MPPAVALVQHRIETVGLSIRDLGLPEGCLQVQAAEHGLLVALGEGHAVLLHETFDIIARAFEPPVESLLATLEVEVLGAHLLHVLHAFG